MVLRLLCVQVLRTAGTLTLIITLAPTLTLTLPLPLPLPLTRTLTRYYELVDTLLIVLRRKRVILLHAFHHASMPLVMWLCFEFGCGAPRQAAPPSPTA